MWWSTITQGHLVALEKESLQWDIDMQMEMGDSGLLEEDLSLYNMRLGDLNNLDGEDHRYWLLAMKAAQQDPRISQENDYTVPGID